MRNILQRFLGGAKEPEHEPTQDELDKSSADHVRESTQKIIESLSSMTIRMPGGDASEETVRKFETIVNLQANLIKTLKFRPTSTLDTSSIDASILHLIDAMKASMEQNDTELTVFIFKAIGNGINNMRSEIHATSEEEKKQILANRAERIDIICKIADSSLQINQQEKVIHTSEERIQELQKIQKDVGQQVSDFQKKNPGIRAEAEDFQAGRAPISDRILEYNGLRQHFIQIFNEVLNMQTSLQNQKERKNNLTTLKRQAEDTLINMDSEIDTTELNSSLTRISDRMADILDEQIREANEMEKQLGNIQNRIELILNGDVMKEKLSRTDVKFEQIMRQTEENRQRDAQVQEELKRQQEEAAQTEDQQKQIITN